MYSMIEQNKNFVWRLSSVTLVFGAFSNYVILVFLTGCMSQKQKEINNAPSVQYSSGLPQVEPRSHDFVGSSACSSCHADIAETFQRHPMGQSIMPIGQETPLENYEEGVFRDHEREYCVVRGNDTVSHQEKVCDADDELMYDKSVSILFALGSGRRGRAYLHALGDHLYQSPIGWYSQRQCWDLSPGFQNKSGDRFTREIDSSCLYCHAGRLADQSSGEKEQTFFHESVIGCERCHGPGKEHVTLMQANQESESPQDLAIVNPGRLGPHRREAVCNQCHVDTESVIPRYGRSFFDFRPGDVLADTRVVFTHIHGNQTQGAVGHVEQMRLSRCYMMSDGAMGCVSCHDPHQVPQHEEKEQYFRQKCLSCHSNLDCIIASRQRHADNNNSCITCHMPKASVSNIPHAALTDHRIVRLSGIKEMHAVESVEEYQDSIQVFDEGHTALPEWEINRAKGSILLAAAMRQRDPDLIQKALQLLLPKKNDQASREVNLGQVQGDVEILCSLGSLFTELNRNDLAEECFSRALSVRPRDASALSGMAAVLQDRGEFDAALTCITNLIAEYPGLGDLYARRASLLVGLGRQDEATKAGLKAIDLDPTLIRMREWLIKQLRGSGYQDRADELQVWLERYRQIIHQE